MNSKQRSKCEHGRQRSQCKECGGSGLCEHSRIQSQCKGGSGVCKHGRQRSQCKECGESFFVNMVDEEVDAKIAEVLVFVNMEDKEVNVKIADIVG